MIIISVMTAGTRHLIARTRPGRAGRVHQLARRRDGGAGRHLGRAVATATGSAPPKEREPHLFDRINQADDYATWLTELGLAEVDVTTHELRPSLAPG
jgi:hypothetical protein